MARRVVCMGKQICELLQGNRRNNSSRKTQAQMGGHCEYRDLGVEQR
jgi:hypothetical protein